MNNAPATHVRRIESDAAATVNFARQILAAASSAPISDSVRATIPAFVAKLRAHGTVELDEIASRLEEVAA